MLRVLVVALSLAAVTGCSLVNPFVIDTKSLKATAMLSPQRPKPRLTLPQAKEYAELVNNRYRTALGDQAKLQSWLGIGLIPLSAAAIGLGASGGPAVAVLATGLAGGAAFGTGTWLINRQRQVAYAAGVKAVTCAVDAMGPLGRVNEADLNKNLTVLATEISKLDRAIAILMPLVGDLERDLKPFDAVDFPEHHQILKEVKAELLLATSLLTTARTTRDSGNVLAGVVGNAGSDLVDAIDKIIATIDEILVDTMRDANALASIINGLGSSYSTITTVPESIRPAAAAETPGKPRPLTTEEEKAREAARKAAEAARKGLNEALKHVKQARADLRAVSATVDAARGGAQAEINRVDVSALATKLNGCGVNAANIVMGLVVEPGPPFALTKGGTIGFVVKGGVGPYFATVSGPGGTKVTVLPVSLQSPAFRVDAASDAPAGDYVITVADTKGQVKQAKLVVDGAGGEKEKDKEPEKRTEGKPTPAAVKTFVDQVSNKVVTVRAADISVKAGDVKPTDSGVAVPVSLDRVGNNSSVAALTPAAVVEALRGMTDAGLSASQVTVDLTGFPQKVTEFQAAKDKECLSIPVDKTVVAESEPLFTPTTALADRHMLQGALCTKQDGVWGIDTKTKFRAYQCETGRMPDGKLNNESRRELINMKPEDVKKRCTPPPKPKP